MGHLNIGPVNRMGHVEIGHSSKTSLIHETEGENLPREWDFRPLCGAVNFTLCFSFIITNINYVTGLAEHKKCPQDLKFTKNRQNKLSHVARR